ncbi:MAG: DDE-type integrase/transposase/recombinase [Bryobacterales bacterium]|nr:DDE-type integrase/transposase/recombinase [Bryobacterales bacterium]
MLDDSEVMAWYARHGFPERTRSVINHIRSSAPARRVGGGKRNVTGRYPSRKMGVAIQFESHRVELAAIYELEQDSDVLEYYDQPPAIKLEYQSASGRNLGVLHTADFFVLRKNGAGWEECKTQDELVHLSRQNENRYCSDDGTNWRCPPGESYAASQGLYYRVRSSRNIDWIFQRNVQFMEDYFRSERKVPAAVRDVITAHVNASPGLSLDQLLCSTAHTASADDIFLLIAVGGLYVDFRRAPFTEPLQVAVFVDHRTPAPATIESGARVIATTTAIETRLAKASESDLRIANLRLRFVSRALRGEAEDEAEAPAGRTLRRWIAAYRKAESQMGSGYVGLLPEPRHGNGTAKLPQASRALMEEFITADYETLKQKTVYASWLALKSACDQKGVVLPSYKTYRLAIRRRPILQQTLKRQGPRAAYQQEAAYWELDFKTPPHGDRPFEIAHIDHTELDVECVCSRTGRVLGRPWLTLLTDAFSRRILAFHLTFDAPSYRSCMMVLRECVRRHSRLPQIIVVDGGREFQSTYFETLLARYEVTKKTRPPAQPRFGSVCERLFGTANTQFLHNLRGNTQLAVKVRQVTQSVNPKGQAIWAFEELQRRFAEYAYEVYDTLSHPALGASPVEVYEAGLMKTGRRAHRQILYDHEFLVLTLPTTPRGTAKVVPGKGIQINYLYYWSDLFRDPEVEKTIIPVRYDPFDAGTAHAFLKGQWIECHSEHYTVFRGRSEKEIRLASQEIRRIRQCHSQQFTITAAKLAEFLGSVEAEEVLLKQRLLDAAQTARTARSRLPVCPEPPAATAPTRLRNLLAYGEM